MATDVPGLTINIRMKGGDSMKATITDAERHISPPAPEPSRKWWTWWRIRLVWRLFPGTGWAVCGNRTWLTAKLGAQTYTLTAQDTTERDQYSREELMAMLQHIRQNELVTGWNVPEPDIALPTITVNGIERWVWPGHLTYDDIVRLAGYALQSGRIFTVDYRKGHAIQQHGTIQSGQRVPVRDGMVINVADTSQA